MPDTTPEEPEERADSDETSVPRSGGSGVSRWVAPIALLIALAAVGLAVWALVSASSKTSPAAPAPTGTPATGEQPSGDPKARACAAVDTVSKAVQLQTHADLGPDPVPQAAVAANARLALLGGGQYLLSHLEPGTPAEIDKTVREFANGLEEIGINALAGVPNSDPAQAGRLTDADLARRRLVDLCK